MSVHGEFARYVEGVSDALQTADAPDLRACAEEIRTLGRDDGRPLSARAEALLDGPLASGSCAAWPPEAVEAADRLVAIARIILGR